MALARAAPAAQPAVLQHRGRMQHNLCAPAGIDAPAPALALSRGGRAHKHAVVWRQLLRPGCIGICRRRPQRARRSQHEPPYLQLAHAGGRATIPNSPSAAGTLPRRKAVTTALLHPPGPAGQRHLDGGGGRAAGPLEQDCGQQMERGVPGRPCAGGGGGGGATHASVLPPLPPPATQGQAPAALPLSAAPPPPMTTGGQTHPRQDRAAVRAALAPPRQPGHQARRRWLGGGMGPRVEGGGSRGGPARSRGGPVRLGRGRAPASPAGPQPSNLGPTLSSPAAAERNGPRRRMRC